MLDREWFFDDFAVGDSFLTRGRTITEVELVNFVTLGGILEEIFLNAQYALNETIFKKRVVPALLIVTIAEGLYIQTGQTHNARAYLGLDELRFHAPVEVGDTIKVRVDVAESRLTSRPDRGILTLKHSVLNHDGDQVVSYVSTRMLGCRPKT
jgi:acyl dehydratase